jgi:hypothetical protein
MTTAQNQTKTENPQETSREGESVRDLGAPGVRPEVIALIRMLLRKPPRGHDFATCPICQRYGIAAV